MDTPFRGLCARPLAFVLVLLASVALLGPATAQESEAPATESDIKIAATAICLAVEEHEPVESAESFAAGVEQLACWTRVTGGEGSTIVHAWIHEGTTRARVELRIGSDSWRTYSTKRLMPSWTGAWEVKIMTPEGVVLKSVPFTIE